MRRALIAVAVLLPAVLVLAARQVGPAVPAGRPAAPADVPPVFVGRVTPAQSFWSVGRPLRVTVEIRADRAVPLAGIRLVSGDGTPAEAPAPEVGPQPRTVPFDVVLPARGEHDLVLQVRLAAGTPWTSLPPGARVVVA